MDRKEVQRTLVELARRARQLARWPQALKEADLEELENHIVMVRYHAITRHEPWSLGHQQLVPEFLRCAECQALGEPSKLPLWQVRGRWLCLKHIPADVTFPLGLWGQEWIESGRSAAGAGGLGGAEIWVKPEQVKYWQDRGWIKSDPQPQPAGRQYPDSVHLVRGDLEAAPRPVVPMTADLAEPGKE